MTKTIAEAGMQGCYRSRCTARPAYLVQMKLRPEKGRKVITMMTSIAVCEEDMQRLKVEDVISGAGVWDRVLSECAHRGLKHMPVKHRTTLSFYSVDKPPPQIVIAQAAFVRVR